MSTGTPLPDIQNSKDPRGVRLPKVGITNFHFPLRIWETLVNAKADAYVSLNATSRGINMSRIGEAILDIAHSPDAEGYDYIDFLRAVLDQLATRLNAYNAYVKIKFPFLMEKEAPISKKVGYSSYMVTVEGVKVGNKKRYYLSVEVQYISCCSCSKALSEHLAMNDKQGAPHNQRSFANVTIQLNPEDILYHIELIALIERAVYTLPYPVIKRADEQEIARRSWAFTQFCEDSVRNIGIALKDDTRIIDWLVTVRHEESIHAHEAVAVLYKGKRGGLR